MRKTCPVCSSLKYSKIYENTFACAKCHFVSKVKK